MEISRRSWHYRLTDRLCEPGELRGVSLCQYFWLVVATLFIKLPAIVGFVFIMALAVLVLVVLFPIWGPVVFLVVRSIDRRIEMERGRLESGGKPAPQPGLLRSWLKAKKDKVCPPITFTD